MTNIDELVGQLNPGARGAEMVSDWLAIDQDRITTFGHVTNDPDPLHIDPDYAREHGPYGSTISFGFLTIALLTHFYREAVTGDARGYALNYGVNRLRLPQVVRVGSRLRGRFRLIDATERSPGHLLMRYDARVEIEDEAKPALIAEWLAMWVDDGVDRRGDDVDPRRARAT